MRNDKEYKLCKAISQFLNYQWPNVIYKWNLSGSNLSMAQAVKMKQLNKFRGFPDLEIMQPIGNKSGLLLEIKHETPYKKDGSLKTNEHLKEQNEMHIWLRERGYCVEFCWDLDRAIGIISIYLNAN